MLEVAFERMNNGQIEELCIQTTELAILYKLDFYIEKKRSGYYVELSKCKDEVQRTHIKTHLSWAENTKDIVKKRQADLRDSVESFNVRFRIEAQKVLEIQVYNEIVEKAKK